jgi:hypothetical protein
MTKPHKCHVIVLRWRRDSADFLGFHFVPCSVIGRAKSHAYIKCVAILLSTVSSRYSTVNGLVM